MIIFTDQIFESVTLRDITTIRKKYNISGMIQLFVIENLRIKDLSNIFKLWNIQTENLFIFSKDNNFEFFPEMLYHRPTPKNQTFFLKDLYHFTIEKNLHKEGYKLIKLDKRTQDKFFQHNNGTLNFKNPPKKCQTSILSSIFKKSIQNVK